MLRHVLLGLAVLLCAAISRGQTAVSDEQSYKTQQTVHPLWLAFEPVFTPYVCPFHADALEYDPDEFRCGYVLVPEDRTDPDSRLIKLSVLHIKSTNASPPVGAIVRLNGGPGTPSLGAHRISQFQSPAARRYRDAADWVFFEQRGVGFSEASLCRALPYSFQYGLPILPDGHRAYVDGLERCIEDARSNGINVEAYSTWQNALDVRDIRRALGYEQWTVFGISYGGQLGQAVLHFDRSGVRSAILDSPVIGGPESNGRWIKTTEGLRSALDALQEACGENARCRNDIGDISEHFIEAIASFEADPLVIDGMDKSVMQSGTFVMDGTAAAAAVLEALYHKELYQDFPSLLKALQSRDPDIFRAYGSALGRPIDHFYGVGIDFVATCKGPNLRSQGIEAQILEDEPQLARWIKFMDWRDACDQILDLEPDPAVRTFTTDIPVLIGSGKIDPVTPPANGRMLVESLTNGKYVEFPYTGHGVFGYPFSDCGGDIVLAFATNPTGNLDTTCVDDIAPPDFQTKLIYTRAPYELATKLQGNDWPVGVIVAVGTLILTLVTLPLGWAARKIEAHHAADLGGARPLIWLGSAASLAAAGWATQMILKTALEHPVALPIGVLPAAGWAGWLSLAGLGLVAFGLFLMLTRLGAALQKPGTFIGLISASAACTIIFHFIRSLGLGLF